MSQTSDLLEESKEVLLDKEHSIGEKAPGTPFVLVALSYLAVLAIASGLFAFFVWAW